MPFSKCPQCGYVENLKASEQPHNEMHEYVTEDGKSFGVLNERDTTVTLSNNKNQKLHGLKLIRKDRFGKAAAAEAKSPVVEKAPIVTSVTNAPQL